MLEVFVENVSDWLAKRLCAWCNKYNNYISFRINSDFLNRIGWNELLFFYCFYCSNIYAWSLLWVAFVLFSITFFFMYIYTFLYLQGCIRIFHWGGSAITAWGRKKTRGV